MYPIPKFHYYKVSIIWEYIFKIYEVYAVIIQYDSS
jgi:hypothetical protein